MRDPKQSVAVLAVAALAMAPAASAAGSPHIRVTPKRVMVNTGTTLRGAGFPANATVLIAECGRTSWLAPSYPCLEEDAQSVRTDAKGRFETTFKAGVCPEGERTKRPTEVLCYVGEPKWTEDTGSLVAAAKLYVSYP
jgi:hypothetical protein